MKNKNKTRLRLEHNNLRSKDLKNKLIIALILSICMIMLVAVVSAEDTVTSTIQHLPQQVVQGQAIDLPQGGSNGTDAWTWCNITRITDPDHNIVLENLVMTKSGFSFNYTLNGAYTQTMGFYTVETACGDGLNVKSGIYSFEVTTTGSSMALSLWIALTLIAISLVLFIIALYANNQYIGFITGMAFVVSGMYVMIYGFGALADLYTQTIAISVIAFGVIIVFISAFHEAGEEGGLSRYFGIEPEERDEYDQFTREDD